jgi:hypothetical protein
MAEPRAVKRPGTRKGLEGRGSRGCLAFPQGMERSGTPESPVFGGVPSKMRPGIYYAPLNLEFLYPVPGLDQFPIKK